VVTSGQFWWWPNFYHPCVKPITWPSIPQQPCSVGEDSALDWFPNGWTAQHIRTQQERCKQTWRSRWRRLLFLVLLRYLDVRQKGGTIYFYVRDRGFWSSQRTRWMDLKSSGVGGDLRIKRAPPEETNIVRGTQRRAPDYTHAEMKSATIIAQETNVERKKTQIPHSQAKYISKDSVLRAQIRKRCSPAHNAFMFHITSLVLMFIYCRYRLWNYGHQSAKYGIIFTINLHNKQCLLGWWSLAVLRDFGPYEIYL
jgi:hypothetical protein